MSIRFHYLIIVLAGAAAVFLDGIAAGEVVGRRCGMQEYTNLEDRDHGRCADVA